jgi:aquaporin Z
MAYGTSSHIEYPAFDEPPMKVEAYISEFVGTYFLVLTIGFNVLQNTALAPISIGAILMAMIFATGKVSGGHFNPAVTLGVYWRGGKISGHDALSYVGSQLVGGLAAGCTYLSILGATFSLGPGAGYGLAAVAIVEVLFTAALVFVVLSVATTAQDDGNWYFGLAIGFTVMAAAFAIGPISGCSLNPAVTFGVLISNFIHSGHLQVSILLLYTLAPLFGSVLAVCLFQIIREQEYQVTKGATISEPRSFRYSQPSSPLSPSQPFAMSSIINSSGGLSPPTSSGRFAYPQV